MEFVGNLQTDKKNIDSNLILQLHKLTTEKILESEKAGVFRENNVVIKNSVTGDVSFRPPDAIKIPYLISDFLAFLNSPQAQDIHPILKSGIVHYELIRIHPFVDGNGRVARALSTLVLFQEGYDIRHFFSLEEYFDNDAVAYYAAIKSADDKDGELTGWLEYFMLGLSIELSKIRDKIEQISRDVQFKAKLGGQPILLTDRQLKIIEYVQKTGFLQNQAFPLLFPMVSEDTILNELKGLLKSGILKKRGVTKGAKYIMS
jgi:Fic family protein